MARVLFYLHTSRSFPNGMNHACLFQLSLRDYTCLVGIHLVYLFTPQLWLLLSLHILSTLKDGQAELTWMVVEIKYQHGVYETGTRERSPM